MLTTVMNPFPFMIEASSCTMTKERGRGAYTALLRNDTYGERGELSARWRVVAFFFRIKGEKNAQSNGMRKIREQESFKSREERESVYPSVSRKEEK